MNFTALVQFGPWVKKITAKNKNGLFVIVKGFKLFLQQRTQTRDYHVYCIARWQNDQPFENCSSRETWSHRVLIPSEPEPFKCWCKNTIGRLYDRQASQLLCLKYRMPLCLKFCSCFSGLLVGDGQAYLWWVVLWPNKLKLTRAANIQYVIAVTDTCRLSKVALWSVCVGTRSVCVGSACVGERCRNLEGQPAYNTDIPTKSWPVYVACSVLLTLWPIYRALYILDMHLFGRRLTHFAVAPLLLRNWDARAMSSSLAIFYCRLYIQVVRTREEASGSLHAYHLEPTQASQEVEQGQTRQGQPASFAGAHAL